MFAKDNSKQNKMFTNGNDTCTYSGLIIKYAD